LPAQPDPRRRRPVARLPPRLKVCCRGGQGVGVPASAGLGCPEDRLKPGLQPTPAATALRRLPLPGRPFILTAFRSRRPPRQKPRTLPAPAAYRRQTPGAFAELAGGPRPRSPRWPLMSRDVIVETRKLTKVYRDFWGRAKKTALRALNL